MEPYILNDKLTTLPPTVMKDFVEHYIGTGQIPTVERCLLHLNARWPPIPLLALPCLIGRCVCTVVDLRCCAWCRTMDLDLTIRLCLQHSLFTALVYVLNTGTEDYTSPVDVLLVYSLDIPTADVRALMKRASQTSGLADYLGTPLTAGTAASLADGTLALRLVGSPEERKVLGLKLLLYLQVRAPLSVAMCDCPTH